MERISYNDDDSSKLDTHLVDGQVNSRVRNDTNQVGYISAIKISYPTIAVYLGGSIVQAFVLAGFAQTKARLEHFHRIYHSLRDGTGQRARYKSLSDRYLARWTVVDEPFDLI